MAETVQHAAVPADADAAHPEAATTPAAAALAALGVVYGDIGTSPLYALKEAAKAAGGGGAPPPEAVLGVLSVILWAIVLVVSVKYAVLIMRADNRGEGGIVALLALLLHGRSALTGNRRAGVLLLGLIGAALLYGDGVITPAISVLSAVEGLKLDAPQLEPVVVPITVAILVGLFLVQRRGTGFVGAIFGPVMLGWFVLLAVLGLGGILRAPGVLAAVSPFYALDYLLHAGPGTGLAVLGASFLALTGAEAMYADMGHFGRWPMRLGWFAVVLPSLALNYFGQGALLLTDPTAHENPFFHLAPDWFHFPLVGLATAATIIASQALISGAFSLTQQAIQLGLLPRVRILHTASHERGQIYVPLVNWLLAVGTIGAVVGFGTSEALAGAYGLAVAALMAITTVLAALVAIQWGYHPLLVLAVNGLFFLLDLVFFGANFLKLFHGGWFPLLLAAAITFVMLTWRSGAALVTGARAMMKQPEEEFVRELRTDPPHRLPGTAVFFTAATSGIPLALTHHLRHNHVLHERVLFLSTTTSDAPRVDPAERVRIEPVCEGIWRVVLRFGFMERPDVPEALWPALAGPPLGPVDPEGITYYFRRETVIPTEQVAGMAVWREALFAMLHLNANRAAAYYGVPTARVVEIGIEVEI
jgi:KUP system potassium uptake protein